YEAPAEPAAVAVATQIPAVTKSPKKKSTGTRKAVKTAGTGTRKGVKTAGTGKPKAFKTAAGTVAGKKKTEKTPAAVAAPAKKVRSAAGGTGKKKAAARAVAKPTYAPEPPRSGLLAKLPTDFTLKLRLANTEETLNIGTDLRFGLTTDRNCYIYLLQYDCEGNPGLLVPGMAGITNALHAEVESQFPNVGNKEYKLVVEPPVGQELIVAIACSKPVDFDSAWRTVVSACASAPEPGQAELQAIEICAAEGLTWSSAILNIRTVQ
ncbi:MAG: DUF4384 domain-containing protein, partial [Akkermansia sp.]|nr:DUF4384 domain-containing protein [Akkermansia sp.]